VIYFIFLGIMVCITSVRSKNCSVLLKIFYFQNASQNSVDIQVCSKVNKKLVQQLNNNMGGKTQLYGIFVTGARCGIANRTDRS